MRQLKTFLVVNPHSANGDTGRRFEQIARLVQAAVGPFEHAFTRGPMDAAAIARRALESGAECVVGVGGDGTLNEVANGFFDEGGRPRSPGAALGVIPRGTGGDFRKSFGWSADLEAAARRLRGDAVRTIDAGRITLTTRDGSRVRRVFVNVASAGVSGRVDDEVNRTTKALGGKASFAWGSFKAMLRHRDQVMRLRFDDGPPETLPATLVAVGNGQFFGGGMWIAPEARLDDGIFDVTVWSGYGLLDFLTKARAIYDGTHVRLPKTRTLRARKVELESDDEVLLDVDGEQPGRLPATFEVLPGALRLKVDG